MTAAPEVVEARLEQLSGYGSEDPGARHAAALLMPLVAAHDGTTRLARAEDYLEELESQICFVCRYMHQREQDLDELTLDALRRRSDRVLELLRAELGIKTPLKKDILD